MRPRLGHHIVLSYVETNEDHHTLQAVPEHRFGSVRVSAVVALMLFLVHASIASAADPVLCDRKVSSYIAELDQLLSQERNWITPYFDLIDRYSTFEDCDAASLLEEVSRSNFIRSITYSSRLKMYVIAFSSDDVRVQFSYEVNTRKSIGHSAGFTRK
jgi:hypothetical protein